MKKTLFIVGAGILSATATNQANLKKGDACGSIIDIASIKSEAIGSTGCDAQAQIAEIKKDVVPTIVKPDICVEAPKVETKEADCGCNDGHDSHINQAAAILDKDTDTCGCGKDCDVKLSNDHCEDFKDVGATCGTEGEARPQIKVATASCDNGDNYVSNIVGKKNRKNRGIKRIGQRNRDQESEDEDEEDNYRSKRASKKFKKNSRKRRQEVESEDEEDNFRAKKAKKSGEEKKKINKEHEAEEYDEDCSPHEKEINKYAEEADNQHKKTSNTDVQTDNTKLVDTDSQKASLDTLVDNRAQSNDSADTDATNDAQLKAQKKKEATCATTDIQEAKDKHERAYNDKANNVNLAFQAHKNDNKSCAERFTKKDAKKSCENVDFEEESNEHEQISRDNCNNETVNKQVWRKRKQDKKALREAAGCQKQGKAHVVKEDGKHKVDKAKCNHLKNSCEKADDEHDSHFCYRKRDNEDVEVENNTDDALKASRSDVAAKSDVSKIDADSTYDKQLYQKADNLKYDNSQTEDNRENKKD